MYRVVYAYWEDDKPPTAQSSTRIYMAVILKFPSLVFARVLNSIAAFLILIYITTSVESVCVHEKLKEMAWER